MSTLRTPQLMDADKCDSDSAAMVDWFRLFGDVRFRILCVGDRSEELSRALRSIHNQEALHADRIEQVAIEAASGADEEQPRPAASSFENRSSLIVQAGSMDMVTFLGDASGQRGWHSSAINRSVDALKPGGWLCLPVSSSIPFAASRKVSSLQKVLCGAGFGRIETMLVYPDFVTPLALIRPNRKMAAMFFKQIYQPRTLSSAVKAKMMRILLSLGAGSSVFRHSLVFAQKHG